MIDLTDSWIGQLDGSHCPSTPRELSSAASEKYVRQANFRENLTDELLELRYDEVRRIPLPRTPVDSSEEGTARGLVILAQNPTAATLVGPSIVQERQVEQPEALRVGEYVDLGDLPARDREAHDRERRAARGPRDDPRDPVH